MARYYKRTKIDNLKEINLIGTPRMMEAKDISQVYSLHKKQQERYQVSFKMSQEELAHHLMPRDDVMYTIVIEHDSKITDFVSFYNLPSQILKREGHNHSMMKVSNVLIHQ
jgi:glycylpeptide N-tetradecanoyltransferase